MICWYPDTWKHGGTRHAGMPWLDYITVGSRIRDAATIFNAVARCNRQGNVNTVSGKVQGPVCRNALQARNGASGDRCRDHACYVFRVWF